MNDVPLDLRRIQALARNILLTYFAGEMETLDPQVLSFPVAVSEIVKFKKSQWRAVWWSGNQV